MFAELLAEDLSRQTGVAHAPKLFRIYRDVRFAKDKSPYNPWLHILWRPASADDLAPGWFFSCAPGELVLGLGVVSLKGPALTRYREWIDKRGDLVSDAMTEVARASGAQLSDFGAAPLTRVPKHYAADHPHADLLKRKGIAMMAPPPRHGANAVLSSPPVIRPAPCCRSGGPFTTICKAARHGRRAIRARHRRNTASS